ncbi:MAG: carbamoyl phosphate synthase large subunit, partial [bacterium]|nr:carbamoyl phosphate synthase large subunit [bacterium]
SMAVLPPYYITREQKEDIIECTRLLARELNVVGLLNIQYAIMYDTLYVLEVNPRASRTVPFVSKSIGVPLAKMAVKVMVGKKVDELDRQIPSDLPYVSIKESVFPFDRFDDPDVYLRPEMRSTGEVMGIAPTFGEAVVKSFQATGIPFPDKGTVFISVNENDKPRVFPVAEGLHKSGFKLLATTGTAKFLEEKNIPVNTILKVSEGRPNVVDAIMNGEIDLIINTPLGQRSRRDEAAIGRTAVKYKVPFYTTLSAAEALMRGVRTLQKKKLSYECLQEYYKK